jgi:hypothetical protein
MGKLDSSCDIVRSAVSEAAFIALPNVIWVDKDEKKNIV